ncbi:MAG: acetyl-CoA carboxylase biotin carboxyl carrier protein subunit [Candidatus Marinimicrobia bacterium]|nr:acetyl-CoA carboxylase biotin carboxyl carrier protein subunit [Candidatus Neomarinimicrobiota bacterium]
MKFQATVDDQTIDFSVETQTQGFSVQINDSTLTIDCIRLSPYSYSLIINGRSYYLSLTNKNGGYRITLDQQSFCVQLKDETQILLGKFGLNKTIADTTQNIISPIPGLVRQVFVKSGDKIEKNDKLLILEAMKMENEIVSTVSGVVSEVYVKPGSSKNKGDPLLRIEGD